MFANPLLTGSVSAPFGMEIIARTADEQAGAWVRPRVPPKRAGRRGTRRAWKAKREHWPHRIWHHEEPADVLVIDDPRGARRRLVIATPRQVCAIKTGLREAKSGSGALPQ